MNLLRVIIFSEIVFFSGFFGCADHRISDNHKRLNGEPNGLSNNGNKCYANAVLQLLAAFFSNEIKNIPRFANCNEEQIRLNLCTIVDHINAKEKRSTGDQKVMNAVRRLIGFLYPNTDPMGGGNPTEFLRELFEKLGFSPDFSHNLRRHKDTFYLDNQGKMTNLNSEDSPYYKHKIVLLQLPDWSHVHFFQRNSGRHIQRDFNNNDEVLKKYWELRSTKCIKSKTKNLNEFEEEFKKVQNEVENDRLSGGQYAVEFTKLLGKLPDGAKILADGNGQRKKKDLILPYIDEIGNLLCLQKFNLVGFIVRPGWHFIAYIKREGTWYEANDGLIRGVSERYIDEKLAKCCDKTSKIIRILSVYEAKN